MLVMTPEEREASNKLARADLYYFSRLTMLEERGILWQRAPHHQTICDALANVYEGRTKRLIINIPPRYGKTQLALNFVTWSLGHCPNSEFIFTSYSGRL